MTARLIALALAAGLAGCSFVRADVTYGDGAGKTVEAHYFSTKDVEAPTFGLERDLSGNPIITFGAGSSLASPVLQQQAAFAAGMAQGITEGLMRGMKAGVVP